MNQGLSQEEAKEKLKIFGYNELIEKRQKDIWQIILEVLKEPMFILLISCSLLYIILGDYREGITLLSTVLVIIFITFYQYKKTEKALQSLKKLTSPRVIVIRDGIQIRIPGIEIVPGDLILLNEGDRIPADAEVIESINFMVDESILTGESLSIEKKSKIISEGQDFLIYSGTLVTRGSAKAKVIFTGMQSQLGKISLSLDELTETPTKLQLEMKILIRNLFIFAALMSLLVILAFYLTRKNWIQSILNGLASAMAILPEEFPVVLTVFLALGAWRLSKINVLTRKPSSIENLGSTTVLCTDKTGTITKNQMSISALYNGVQLFDSTMFLDKKDQLVSLLESSYFASSEFPIDPMEKAILETNYNLFNNRESNHKLIKEYSLSHQLLAMTRVLENKFNRNLFIATKGSPETIFTLCKLDLQEIQKHSKILKQLSENGYRVIGVANQPSFPQDKLPETQNEFNFQFLGLIAFEDPIRPEVPHAIQECKNAGIQVIMITGDSALTAKSIANQIGLNSSEVITGEELRKMNDEELSSKIKTTSIFARVIPEQKLRIVQILKSNGEIVAMTGDGVNDAPALKAADIGISMGKKGTDVAREASSLVLLDDNFASIVSGIRLGRKIFDNLQKAMSYIIAIHIPIIGVSFMPAVLPDLPIILLPLHIVFMEMIIDPVCSIVFETAQEEKGIMNQPPKNLKEPFFGLKKIGISSLEGLFFLGSVLFVYFFSIRENHSVGEIRAITFSSLIIGNIFLILTKLSQTRSFISSLNCKNLKSIFILLAAIVLLIFIITVPVLQIIFSFEFPGIRHFIISILSSFIILLLFELFKFMKWKFKKIRNP